MGQARKKAFQADVYPSQRRAGLDAASDVTGTTAVGVEGDKYSRNKNAPMPTVVEDKDNAKAETEMRELA